MIEFRMGGNETQSVKTRHRKERRRCDGRGNPDSWFKDELGNCFLSSFRRLGYAMRSDERGRGSAGGKNGKKKLSGRHTKWKAAGGVKGGSEDRRIRGRDERKSLDRIRKRGYNC